MVTCITNLFRVFGTCGVGTINHETKEFQSLNRNAFPPSLLDTLCQIPSIMVSVRSEQSLQTGDETHPQENNRSKVDNLLRYSSKLKRKLKDTNGFVKDEFVRMLKQFLEKIGEKCGISEANPDDLVKNTGSEIQKLVEKNGFLMGRDVCGLVLKGCIHLELWELVEILISNSLVDHSSYSYLVSNLVKKHQSYLLCVVIKQASDLGAAELLSILKYLLFPSKEAITNMVKVREEWESESMLAVEKVSITEQSKNSKVAEEAAILLMLAHDGFSPSELCLHYLLASRNIDEVMFASAVSKLNGNEMSNFIRYLSKWVKKYEMFPQAGPSPKAASKLGLKLCNWVPELEDITKCLALIIDENFSTLVLHSDLHEELKSIARVADGLASESIVCCFMPNVFESLKLGAI